MSHTHNREPPFAHPVFILSTAGRWPLSLRCCPARGPGTPKEPGTGLGHSFQEEGRGPIQGLGAASWGPRTSGSRAARGAGPHPHAVGRGQGVVRGAPCGGGSGGPGESGGRCQLPSHTDARSLAGIWKIHLLTRESVRLLSSLYHLISDLESSPVNNCLIFV